MMRRERKEEGEEEGRWGRGGEGLILYLSCGCGKRYKNWLLPTGGACLAAFITTTTILTVPLT